MATKKNIIVGAARIFLGPSMDPTTSPGQTAISALKPASTSTATTVSVMVAASNWRDVGYTTDGLEVATDPSWSDIEVDQLLDAAKIFKDGMSVTVSTTFAEATLENLLVAWGQADSYSESTANVREVEVDGGSLGQAPLERGLVAIGNGPEKAASNAYTERTYYLYRVLSVDAASHSLSRSEATTIPVSFRALPADNGKYGSIRDRLNVV